MTSPVGSVGNIFCKGDRDKLYGPAYDGPEASNSAPPLTTYSTTFFK